MRCNVLCFYVVVFFRKSNKEQSDQILQEVSQKIQSYPFSFQGADILTGTEEGAYGWVTVNYLLENFIKVHKCLPTVS